MRPVARVYTFGGFTLDPTKRVLTRGDTPIPVTEHQLDVLIHLVMHPGEIVTKDALIDAAWRGVAVTDNSLEQAISTLRKTLGDGGAKSTLIETVPRRGYRFRGDVTMARADARASDAELAALLDPYREWIEGRVALETLERDAVLRARQAFDAAVAKAPDHPSAHLGLANACVLQFESTRADEAPDVESLARADHHAREACRLAPDLGEAWATLALVLYRSELGVQSIAAARRAVMLEPDNWRHHFRLAYVGWGEERLRAAQRVLALFPGFALAHWLSATVYVARQAFDAAEQSLRAGAAAQDAQQGTRAFSSIGAYWLLGLVMLARGDAQAALDAWHRELTFETSGQLYARECAANTWYAIGCVMLRQQRHADAIAAFEQALQRVPSHVLAMIGLSVAGVAPDRREALERDVVRLIDQLAARRLLIDAAIARAVKAVCAGNPDVAPGVIEAALDAAPVGNAGWTISVDPLLNVSSREGAFAQVLARLRTRAA
jgi:DNA-binding winged helix-turn-helix (wHTH) protein/cytochrome c-type biogenesis protein CcmH/NrfG